MNGPEYAKNQLESTFNLLNMAIDGLDETQYNWSPSGTCNAIVKSHVHALTAVDFFVLGSVKGGQMLWPGVASTNGLPANPTEIWGHQAAVPIPTIKEYGQQVTNAALEYVATLSDGDLDRIVETQFFGKQPVSFLLQLTAMHTAGHAGDIAAVKGMQGMKGLPF